MTKPGTIKPDMTRFDISEPKALIVLGRPT